MNRAQRLAVSSLVAAVTAISGQWWDETIGRVLPLFKNPVDLTWFGLGVLLVMPSVLALTSVGLGVEARRLVNRTGTWSLVGWAGVVLGFLAVGLYLLQWFGSIFVERMPWQHPW